MGENLRGEEFRNEGNSGEMNILHVNERIEIAGGVETFIDALLSRWPKSTWISVRFSFDGVEIQTRGIESTCHVSFQSWATSERVTERYSFIFIHSVSEPRLIRELYDLGLPLIRFVHEPRMFCPGHSKYLLNADEICCRPFGLHCVSSAYLQKCAPRNPKALVKALSNSFFEKKSSPRYYSLVVCMSEYIFNQLSEAQFEMKNVHIVPYFVSGAICKTKTYGHKKIVYAGRLIEHKGVHIAIEAVAPLLLQDPQLTFEIIGTGMHGYEKRLREFCLKLGIGDQVKWLGWLNQSAVKEHIGGSTVVVFPSVYPEAFGIVGIEAMSLGKPVVAFDVGGVSDWLEHEKTGFLLKERDVPGMTQAIHTLLTDEHRRERMGDECLTVAKAKFSLRAFEMNLESALSQISVTD